MFLKKKTRILFALHRIHLYGPEPCRADLKAIKNNLLSFAESERVR